ncbi:ParA family protein [Streptomyces yaizuensis]|uniref:ParA family protein n=1 Tax=Streptomyces yaizuensis TaxID=2989713 RepID=A0AA86IX26_9ACTN|nr:AAA family ATPase [Streptomyces sp. YSPA8]BDT39658.1 ParA family protein [Streptomyces sp. YSPA8]
MTETQVVGSYSETGGVTKTASAVSLAVAYAVEHPDEDVILGDLDPRAAATKWTGASPKLDEKGNPLDMSAILAADDVEGWADAIAVPLDPERGWPRNLRVIPSSRALSAQEKTPDDHAERRLRRSLIGTSAAYVSLDFPNRQGGVLTQNGLTACTKIVYAARPDEDGLDGVDGAKITVAKFHGYQAEDGLPKLPREVGIILGAAYVGAVWTRDARRAEEEFKRTSPGMLLKPYVEWRAIVKEARSAGEFYSKYGGKAGGDRVFQTYRDLLTRIV